jgi:hypothetical protein
MLLPGVWTDLFSYDPPVGAAGAKYLATLARSTVPVASCSY